MSIYLISRRKLLTLSLAPLLAPLASLLGPLARAWGAEEAIRGTYTLDARLLYEVISFQLTGTIREALDPEGLRYRVTLSGTGSRIDNKMESAGVLRGGRWAPVVTRSWFRVLGRESRSEIAYDHDRRTIAYHAQGETFLLRRQRVADDRLPLPEGLHVDDAVSAALNYADRRWPPEGDGIFRTHVVRRQRPSNEGPDDVAPAYRAEILPFVLQVEHDPATGRATALVDLSRFSSWVRPNEPARVLFGPDRRPELITSEMILGSSVTIRLARA